jgi:hypothetical protein
MTDFAEAWSDFAEVSFFPLSQYKGKKKKGDLDGGLLENKMKMKDFAEAWSDFAEISFFS